MSYQQKFIQAGTILSFVVLATLVFSFGCNRNQGTFGGGQQANSNELEKQNQNLVNQVVQATEELEKHPDPTFLKNAVGRLNSWLQKKPVVKDFQVDSQFRIYEEKFLFLARQIREAGKLYSLFAEDSQTTPTEQDGERLIAILGTIEDYCNELSQTIGGDVLKNYATFVAEMKTKLVQTKEFQFADPVATLQTAIRQFEISPWFQFDNYAKGLEDFAALLNLDERAFRPEDADYLKQTVWLRNISHWAQGKKQDDLEIVKNLFDWTVQNISLIDARSGLICKTKQLPWETILLSQGTPVDRATVFMELLRQNRIDSFIVAPNAEVSQNAPDFPLIVGVRLGDDVYLFLPELGLPIPGKDGLVLDGGIRFQSIATLTEAASDDALLRKLDFSNDEKFPLTSSQLQNVVAKVPTNPFLTSERMTIIEQDFSANIHTVLATSWNRQQERIAAMKGISKVEHFWDGYAAILEHLIVPIESEIMIQPYLFEMTETENLDSSTQTDRSAADAQQDGAGRKSPLRDATVLNSPLWIGKILYMKGNFVGENSSAFWLQQGRVSDRILKESVSRLRERTDAMLTQIVEQNAAQQKTLSNEELQSIAQQYVQMEQQQHFFKVYMKVAARFYLALISIAVGNDDTALTHLEDNSLLEEIDGLWKTATLYLIARINEKKGNYQNAVAIYRTFNDKYGYGNRLRGKWLEELTRPAEPTPANNEPVAESVPDSPAEPAPANNNPVAESVPDSPAEPTPANNEPADESVPDSPVEPAPANNEPADESVPDSPVEPAPANNEPVAESVPDSPAEPAPANNEPADESVPDSPAEPTPANNEPAEDVPTP